MRVITLDNNKKVIGYKLVGNDCALNENDIISELGDVGQIMQEDGSFITPDPTPIELQPTLEEMQTQALLNTEYLVVMSELTNI